MPPSLDPQIWQLETRRLIIRAPRPNEGRVVNSAIHESFEELHRWMPWARTLPSVEETEGFLRQGYEKFAANADLPMLFWLKDGTFAGATGLHRANCSNRSFEIGYWCRTSLCGQGYTCEVVRALTGYAFDSLEARRLEIRFNTRNLASRRVAEKCGFTFEFMLRNFDKGNDGKLRDMHVFSKI
jgi:RimJ/RimL family protein N-acetyltransferase